MQKQKVLKWSKPLKLLTGFIFAFTFIACHNPEPVVQEVMTADGPWKARISEMDNKIQTIHDNRLAYDEEIQDGKTLKEFSTEYPFWEKMILLREKGEIRKAILITGKSDKWRKEEFYFSDGQLIFATILTDHSTDPDPFQGKQFYFYQNKLVKAVTRTEELDKNNDDVALKSLDLIKEGQDILNLYNTHSN